MIKHGKKYIKSQEQLQKEERFSFKEGLEKVKTLSFVNFDETIDADVSIGIDPTKGDQTVRGSVLLPHGIGKEVRVIVFAKGEYAEKAKKAGADIIGSEDLIEKISGGWIDFDYAVATPDMMSKVGKLAKILGPRGLLPNKKLGTVTFDVETIVSDLKRGRVFFKNDKNAIVHFSFGKVSFDINKLYENLNSFIKALIAAKPPTSKGKFLKKITLSSTMGPGIQINPDDVINI